MSESSATQTKINQTLRTCCIIGECGSGKTTELVAHIATLIEKGAQPNELIAFVATPSAINPLKERLLNAVGTIASTIEITTVRSQALKILSTPEAELLTGRKPRMLFPFEINMIMEDLKTTGVPPKRLKEMLKFFYRGWTELADADPGWLLYNEERLVHNMIKDRLLAMKAVMEPEIANLALGYLCDNEAALKQVERNHVVIDDFGLMSRASQVLGIMHAKTSICITAIPELAVEVFDSHPYPAGINEFCGSVSDCKVEKVTRKAAPANTTGSRPDDSQETTRTFSFPSPTAELEGIAACVSGLLEEGFGASDIYVAAPNRAWERNIRQALMHRDVKSCSISSAHAFGGDVRYYERCKSARIFTALSLAADPDDPLAWRNWCGFGDYLAHSVLMAELGPDDIIALLEELERKSHAEARLIRDEQELLAAFRHGKYVIAKMKEASRAGTSGKDLLSLAANSTLADPNDNTALYPVPGDLLDICEPCDGFTASTIVAQARNKLANPVFSNEESVRVGSYAHAYGVGSRVLIITGFVNGFFPIHDYFDEAKLDKKKRVRLHESSEQLIQLLAGESAERLIVTYFHEATLEEAGALGLKVERIRACNGRRMCDINASIFMETLESWSRPEVVELQQARCQ